MGLTVHGGGLALPAICPVALLRPPLHNPIAHGRVQSGTRGTMGALPSPYVTNGGACRVPIARLLWRGDEVKGGSAQADCSRRWVRTSDSAHQARPRRLFRPVSASLWVCRWVRGARLPQPNVQLSSVAPPAARAPSCMVRGARQSMAPTRRNEMCPWKAGGEEEGRQRASRYVVLLPHRPPPAAATRTRGVCAGRPSTMLDAHRYGRWWATPSERRGGHG